MERKIFLKMCERVSALPAGVGGVPKRIPNDLLVVYKKSKYFPFYYEMKFKNGEYYEIAVLHDLKANSVLHVPLEKIKKYTD